MKKTAIWIICIIFAVVALGSVAAIIWFRFGQIPNSDQQGTTEEEMISADVRDVLGETITVSELLCYLDNTAEHNLNDEFSKVYSEAVQIKVASLDGVSQKATLEVYAPPLGTILEECIPADTSGDFDVIFEKYMVDVQNAVSDWEIDSTLPVTVYCDITGEEDLLIVANGDLFNAVFPDMQSLLGEILVQMLVNQEG